MTDNAGADEAVSYTDADEPLSKPFYQVVTVDSPTQAITVFVRVYASDGLAELERYNWFGKQGPKHVVKPNDVGYRLSEPEDREIWDRNVEVFEWLAEWELVKLERVGPEDSEYFATDKLLNPTRHDW